MSKEDNGQIKEFIPSPFAHVGHKVTLNNTGDIVAEVICLDDKVTVYRDSLFDPHPKGVNHVGHDIEIVTYGPYADPVNVSIECLTCNEVIYDEDFPEEDYSAEVGTDEND